MWPWMAIFTIGTDVLRVIARLSMILFIFFPSCRLTVLGNKLILHASDLHDNATLPCPMKRLTNVKPCMKPQMIRSRRCQWITSMTLVLWHSFVAMTSHSSSPILKPLANNRNIVLHSLNTSFLLSHLRLM